MNIILEGCDCSGKTSIAKELAKQGYKYNHYSNPKTFEDGKNQMYEISALLDRENKLVLDRAFLGEYVYSPIYRGYYPSYDIYESLINDDVILFLITANEEIIKERFDNKFISKEMIPKIINSYFVEFAKCPLKRKYVIDTSKMTTEECLKVIEKIIKYEDDKFKKDYELSLKDVYE